MGLFKEAEIGFRKFLVLFLGLFIHRSRAFDSLEDFNSSKFLFIRQDRIGDVLVSTPLFPLLKERFPAATIDILLSRNNYSVLENEPFIRQRWLYEKSIASTWKLIRALRREKYDVVIDLMDNPSATSTLFLALAGGKWNVGLTKDNSYVYDVKVPLPSRKDVHIVDRLAQLLTPFGVKLDSKKLHIRYNPTHSSDLFAEHVWQANGFVGRKVIGINISSGSKARFWGESNFRGLVQELAKSYPDSVALLLYHPRDEQHVRTIADSLANAVVCPPTDSFDQFAAVIKRLNILVTPDTSAVHLAAAFQIPSVVLYVQSNKELRIWEPYNAPTVSLVTDVDDLTAISVSAVYNGCRQMLQHMLSPHGTFPIHKTSTS
ncbi:MAG: glycosyltransferase family 9 protein [Ignavibacteriae bacterium]|nr:glycosyltransferase family 9 protein [Ignavibacteriota bacterium]